MVLDLKLDCKEITMSLFDSWITRPAKASLKALDEWWLVGGGCGGVCPPSQDCHTEHTVSQVPPQPASLSISHRRLPAHSRPQYTHSSTLFLSPSLNCSLGPVQEPAGVWSDW